MIGDLYKRYKDWIDWEMFNGLSYEDREALEEKNRDKYGLNFILKAGAPESAVEAWKEDAKRTKKADSEGMIYN